MADEDPPTLGYAEGATREADRATAAALRLTPIAKGLCVVGFVVSMIPCVGMVAFPIAVAGVACAVVARRKATRGKLDEDLALENCLNLGTVALVLSAVQAAVPAVFTWMSGLR